MQHLHTRSGDQMVEEIDRLHLEISVRQRHLLAHVVEFDRARRYGADGCRDMAQWLSGRLGISNWAARRWVAAGYALEHLPLISRALGDGVLCLDKVLELARFATSDTEAKLITWARRVSAAAIRRRADRANRPALEEAQEAERARYLRWWWFDEGNRMGFEGELPAAEGAAVATALKRVAERLPEPPPDDASDVEPWVAEALAHNRHEQRHADALVALASHELATDADSDRATVVVHTALGEHGFGELQDGPALNSEVARRLSCDARLQFVLTDTTGNALGIGQTARNVPVWLMRELRFRDHGCTFPGCGTRAFLNAHHIVHWDHGGPTDLDNLVLVCGFHHKLVHELGWRVSLHESTAQWFRPNGKRYDPGPDPPVQESIGRPAIEEGLAVAV